MSKHKQKINYNKSHYTKEKPEPGQIMKSLVLKDKIKERKHLYHSVENKKTLQNQSEKMIQFNRKKANLRYKT